MGSQMAFLMGTSLSFLCSCSFRLAKGSINISGTTAKASYIGTGLSSQEFTRGSEIKVYWHDGGGPGEAFLLLMIIANTPCGFVSRPHSAVDIVLE